MILVNRTEVEPVISSMLCMEECEGQDETYISIDEESLKKASEGAGETLALVQKADEPLEKMAESLSQEIAFVQKRQEAAAYDCLVAIRSYSDVLMSELCIVSDLLRKAAGESPLKVGLKYIERTGLQSITMLMRKK